MATNIFARQEWIPGLSVVIKASAHRAPLPMPDNTKYAAMTPEDAARAFLEAVGREDWTEAGKFDSPITDGFKQDRGGLQVISIGKAFTSAISAINGAQFVPYEIKLKSGQINKHNLALKKDRNTSRWFVDGGI